MSAAAAIIAAVEEDFKNYIIVCENLKLDPRVVYEQQVIDERARRLLECANTLEEKKYKKLTKMVERFKKHYSRLVGKSYGFIKRVQKLIEKEQLSIHPETVSDEFSYEQITQKNYDAYNELQKKLSLKVMGIVAGVLLAIAAVVATVIALL